MRIVIDMQGALFFAQHDPICRLAVSFARAICEHSGDHEVLLALHGRNPKSVEWIRAEFQALLPQERIRVWHGAERTNLSADDQASANELIREAFLSSLGAEIVLFTGNLFDLEQSGAEFSVGRLGMAAAVTAWLHHVPSDVSPEAVEKRNRAKGSASSAFFVPSNVAQEGDEGSPPVAEGADSDATALNAAALLVVHNHDYKHYRLPANPSDSISPDCVSEVLAIWTQLCAKAQTTLQPTNEKAKPRLAYVSPLPPERTGIADYSAELIPFLSEHYEIIVISDQKSITDPWIEQHCEHHDSQWLRANKTTVDRVLYHLGNSDFHKHMPSLLEDVPGVVVLHDFYLSGLYAWLECVDGKAPVWTKALYEEHGYKALAQRFSNPAGAQRDYPVSFDIISRATGVIVHSEYSRTLGRTWYPKADVEGWERIPLLRVPAPDFDRAEARRRLDLPQETFIVCSFGFLGETKLNHRLLKAWKESSLSSEGDSLMIFVGELPSGEYRTRVRDFLKQSKLSSRVLITGFADPDTYRLYLQAADIAIQLRTTSRGETSAAVLDCMAYGVPVVANANGAMAELDPQAVYLLPDDFEDEQLIEAIESLWRDRTLREAMGARGREIVRTRHDPAACARAYRDALEHFYRPSEASLPDLIQAIAEVRPEPAMDEGDLVALARALAQDFPLPRPTRCIYLDITATCSHDLRTGIERVARALTLSLLESPPEGYRIEPVYLSNEGGRWHYRHARAYTLGLLDCPTDLLRDEVAEPENGDVLVCLDISGERLVQATTFGLLSHWRALGCTVRSVVYDLLPLRMPQVFPPGADQSHRQWLEAVLQGDGALCISRAVADELKGWIGETGIHFDNRRPFRVDWFHLGADLLKSGATAGLPSDASQTLDALRCRPSFLMVGTIEPRKGYLQVIEAFDRLWAEGLDANLVIVGQEGWKGLPDESRRDIPQTIERLRNHPQLGAKLYWLDGISDEYLEQVYAASTCLIAASYGEGFGLPLIEAAQHKLPIIARDIPVFREVAGAAAYFFTASSPEDMANSLRGWMELADEGQAAASSGICWQTWRQAAECVAALVIRHETPVAVSALEYFRPPQGARASSPQGVGGARA